MKALSVLPLKTEIFSGGDLARFILDAIPKTEIREEMVLAVTSKIVSIAENRLVSKSSLSKAELVERESDLFLGEIGYGCFLTIKEGLLIPSAGIDESNSQSGDYILYPKDPYASTERLWKILREKWGLRKLGVILTDSHTTPLRRGVTGIALSYWGFQPIRKMVGTKDLFGRELMMTNMNLVDGMASAAVMMMGEGSESTPLAIINGLDLEFQEGGGAKALSISLEEDLYGPLITSRRPFCRS